MVCAECHCSASARQLFILPDQTGQGSGSEAEWVVEMNMVVHNTLPSLSWKKTKPDKSQNPPKKPKTSIKGEA